MKIDSCFRIFKKFLKMKIIKNSSKNVLAYFFCSLWGLNEWVFKKTFFTKFLPMNIDYKLCLKIFMILTLSEFLEHKLG